MNIAPLIHSQISEKIYNDAPLFVAFMELYYKYAQLRKNSLGSIQYRNLDVDIDTTLDEYVSEFYSTYGQNLPSATALDSRIVIKLLDDVYKSKGTEKSFSLLFKILFDIDTEYKKPSDQILKTSDGHWVQEVFITVEMQSGSFNSLINSNITLIDNFGTFEFILSQIEIVSENRCRLFFKNYSLERFVVGSTVKVIDSSGTDLFVGIIQDSINSVSIVSGGLSFQAGQIFIVPGTIKNTVLRISSVSSTGSINGIEILDYGYIHIGNEYGWIIPYNTTPDANISISSTGISPKTYNVNISEYTLDFTESLSGNDSLLYKMSNLVKPNSFSASLPSNDNEDFKSANAYIKFNTGPVAKLLGRYTDNLGHLSDSYIKLQDNYYYQLFSYVVYSEIDLSKYKNNILKVLHPAGMKYFSMISKNVEVDISSGIYINFDFARTFRLNISESVLLSEFTYKNFNKVLNTSIGSIDSPAFTDEIGLMDSVVVNGDNAVWESDDVYFRVPYE